MKKSAVLIVEDNELVADCTRINFTELGCEVDIALNGKMALEYAQKKTLRPYCDGYWSA